MSDFLAIMASASRRRAEATRRTAGMTELTARASRARQSIPLVLSDEGFDLIAETKLASPSQGRLATDGDDDDTVLRLASGFTDSGAAAISVLTEPSRFGGELDHLERVAAAVSVPVMRKDFLVDPIQVLEARARGASGVLLIARIVETASLVEMTDLALTMGMFVVVEIFDTDDLDVASAVFDRDVLVGVNARDLGTLDVDPGRHRRLVRELPDLPLVAESGVLDASDAERVAGLGYRLALVGSSLVSSRDPFGLATEMIRAGRSAVRVKEAH